jgi:uncharacterized tellurite resistance protein B-like protein
MSVRDDWTELHHLAYIYAAIASSDGSISEDEMEVYCHKLHQWNPDVDAEELMQLVMAAVSALGRDKERVGGRYLNKSIEIVAGALDDEGRAAALDDLLAIAAADGTLMPGEGELLLTIRKAWEVDRTDRRGRRTLRTADGS